MCLVGAGPGDAGLITVRGRQMLERADVVIYDALVGADLLDLAPVSAQRIDVGKRPGAHKLTQDQINELMVEKARQGLAVVRLKGGDPYLFGRGGEEAAYLVQHGVAFDVVPGLTAAVAVPGAAGIPLTHRNMASTVTFATGHEDPTKGASSVDYAALAALIKAGGTVCFYMGISRIGAIVEALTAQGVSNDQSAAAVQWATTPRQKAVRTTLASLQEAVASEGVWAPSIIVVGQVAGLDIPFDRRVLTGKTVIVTRSQRQSSTLHELLSAQGARVLESPTIEVHAPGDVAALDAAVADPHDWLVLTSANGVDALADSLQRQQLDARCLAGAKIAVVGGATADALYCRLRLRAELTPDQYDAKSLAAELIKHHNISGKRIALLRADIAADELPDQLTAAGAIVADVAAYETRSPDALPAAVLDALHEGVVDWITFTSSSTARNMVALLGDEKNLLAGVNIASIGPVTSQAIRDCGYEPTVQADPFTAGGLVDAIVKAQTTGT